MKTEKKLKKEKTCVRDLLPSCIEVLDLLIFNLLILPFIILSGELQLHYLKLAIVVLIIFMPTILTNSTQHQLTHQTFLCLECLLLTKIRRR